MTPINPVISVAGARVKGVLYDEYPDPEYLDQDILQVSLPNGVTIDVGWYPESDPTGSFRIVVYRGDWLRQLQTPIDTRNPQIVAAQARWLAEQYAQDIERSQTVVDEARYSLAERVGCRRCADEAAP